MGSWWRGVRMRMCLPIQDNQWVASKSMSVTSIKLRCQSGVGDPLEQTSSAVRIRTTAGTNIHEHESNQARSMNSERFLEMSSFCTMFVLHIPCILLNSHVQFMTKIVSGCMVHVYYTNLISCITMDLNICLDFKSCEKYLKIFRVAQESIKWQCTLSQKA